MNFEASYGSPNHNKHNNYISASHPMHEYVKMINVGLLFVTPMSKKLVFTKLVSVQLYSYIILPGWKWLTLLKHVIILLVICTYKFQHGLDDYYKKKKKKKKKKKNQLGCFSVWIWNSKNIKSFHFMEIISG